MGEAYDVKSLNPALDNSAISLDVSMLIFSYAIRYDGKGNPVPDALREVPTLANGDVSKDGLTLHYKLRPNITWQDGKPLTCEDLKFTWHYVMNPKTNVAITDGYRESEQSWKEVLLDLKSRGLEKAPELAIGDGALGFWKALPQMFGQTRAQRCWVHKTANVLNYLPRGLQGKAKAMLHAIWMAETRAERRRISSSAGILLSCSSRSSASSSSGARSAGF